MVREEDIMTQASIDDCAWPELSERYDRALREAVRFILGRFPETVAIAAAGTIIRGVPSRSSDLDLYVIHDAPYYQRLQYFFSGVPAEIFVNPEAQVYEYLENELQSARPITAHMLATGFPVLDVTGALARLRARGRAVLDAGPTEPVDRTRPRYMIGSLYEDAVDVLDHDPDTARLLANRVVWEALSPAFTFRRLFIPRPKSLIARLREIDADLHALVVAYLHESDARRAVAIAGDIAERVAGVRGFFEWESEPRQANGTADPA
jgi:hypothetical protein